MYSKIAARACARYNLSSSVDAKGLSVGKEGDANAIEGIGRDCGRAGRAELCHRFDPSRHPIDRELAFSLP